MNHLLKIYYHLDIDLKEPGYFTNQQQLYYLGVVKDLHRFLEIYRYYRYLLHAMNIQGFYIVKNNNQDLISECYILLKYEKSAFSFPDYLNFSLRPIGFMNMKIKNIKEQWIQKIDCVKEQVKNYAYSFKHDQDMISLIYYYCGIGENSINLLNYILSIDEEASIPFCLSLLHPIENSIYEILNPFHYTFSSRARHLNCLLKSRLISLLDIKDMIENQYYNVFELLYLFARTLYPSFFFDQVLYKTLSHQDIQNCYTYLEEEKLIYHEMMRILSFYVTIPKISWINEENML